MGILIKNIKSGKPKDPNAPKDPKDSDKPKFTFAEFQAAWNKLDKYEQDAFETFYGEKLKNIIKKLD